MFCEALLETDQQHVAAHLDAEYATKVKTGSGQVVSLHNQRCKGSSQSGASKKVDDNDEKEDTEEDEQNESKNTVKENTAHARHSGEGKSLKSGPEDKKKESLPVPIPHPVPGHINTKGLPTYGQGSMGSQGKPAPSKAGGESNIGGSNTGKDCLIILLRYRKIINKHHYKVVRKT